LNSDSTLIWTCFLNLLLKFTRITYLGNLYPIGLPDWLTRISPGQLTRSSSECLIQALFDHINVYSTLYVHTRPNLLTRFFSQSDFYLPSLTRSYPTELPYPILSRSDFCLPDRTQPPYLTSLPDRITLRCTFHQAVLHHVKFCGVTHAPCFLRNLYVKAKNIRPQPCKRFSQNRSFMLTTNDYP
jgi:hypothetical protein